MGLEADGGFFILFGDVFFAFPDGEAAEVGEGELEGVGDFAGAVLLGGGLDDVA